MDSEVKTSLLARLTSASASEAPAEVSPNEPGEGERRVASRKPSTKTNMAAREVRVNVTGLHTGEAGGQREVFTEEAYSVLVHENGAVIQLSTEVKRGQLLLLSNVEEKREAVAQVKRTYRPMNRCVELEFAEPAPRFWGMDFSAATALLPKDPKLAEASAPLSAEASPDESSEPLPVPTPEEVQALKGEVKAPPDNQPSVAAVEESQPVEHYSHAASPSAATQQTQPPDTSLKFAVPLPRSRRLVRPRGRFTPGAALRLTMLSAALVLTIISAAWYKHWFSGKSAGKKSSVTVPTAGSKMSPSLPTADREATLEHSGLNSNVVSDAPGTSPVAPSQVAESADRPAALSASGVEPVAGKTPAAKSLTAKPATVRPAPRATSEPKAASSGESVVVPPKLIRSVRAVASLDSLRDFETGNVVIDAVVDTEGEVIFVGVISGPPSLRAPAVEAVKQYRYEPATRNGQPVPEHVHITVRFRFES